MWSRVNLSPARFVMCVPCLGKETTRTINPYILVFQQFYSIICVTIFMLPIIGMWVKTGCRTS